MRLNDPRLTTRITGIVWSLFRMLTLSGLCFVLLYPVLFMLSMSLRPVDGFFARQTIWIPETVTLQNFLSAFEMLDFLEAFGNTLKTNVVAGVLQVLPCAVTAYGFARFRFRFKEVLFALVIFSIIVPTQLTMVPLFLNYRFFDFLGLGSLPVLFGGNAITINLIGSGWTFYLPALLSNGIRAGLFIFIFRQFFRSMPLELEDAAYIDGSGLMRTFFSVILPNAVPVFVTVLIFSIAWYWNDFYSSSMFGGNTLTIPLAIMSLPDKLSSMRNISGGGALTLANFSLIQQASCLIAIAPMMLVYIFLQRYFVEGIERSGIVG